MGEASKAKQVYFIGIWQAQQVNDQLLRQISNQITNKKKVLTILQVTEQGLGLTLLDHKGKVTRQDRVPLENIVDFIDNKYSTTCTLAIARDKQQKLYKVYVFVCRSDRDAAELIHVFKTTKRQLSGEGYNTNLTPKGKNWTLQQKRELNEMKTNNVPNSGGTVVTTAKQNGGVTVIQTGVRHDSLSRQSETSYDSDIKDELNHLADEVRDIKRLLQGSKGRSQFEKHYGYTVVEMPISGREPTQVIESVRTDDAQELPTIKRETLYVKNSNSGRYAEPPKIYTISRVGGGVARSTRQYKSDQQMIAAPNPQPHVAYTKRVYDSRNPALDRQYVRVQSPPPRPVKYFSKTFRSIIFPRNRKQKPFPHGSDIIHRNIEDVYKSRSLRRIYLPPSPNSVVEYVNSQIIDDHRQRQRSTAVENGISQKIETVRISHAPEVRTLYENVHNVAESSNSSNVSTNVNISVNDDLDDKMRQIQSSIELKEDEQNDDDDDIPHEINDIAGHEVGQNVIGGDAYHVTTKLEQGFEKKVPDYENVVVTKTERSKKFVKNNIRISEKGRSDVHKEVVNELRRYNEANTGLFGAYVRKPNLNEARGSISKEEAYRYHDDDEEEKENIKDRDTEKSDLIEEKRVRYNETVEHIPDHDNVSDRLNTDEVMDDERHHPDFFEVYDSDNNDDNLENNADENNDEKDKSDDEESYHLDTEALRAFTSEPDIVIVESNGSNIKNTVKDNLAKHKYSNSVIHEITTRAEDTVLF